MQDINSIEIFNPKWGCLSIDIEDYPIFKSQRFNPNNKGYLCSYRHSLHRLIMNPPFDKCIDHINGDKLDNRKSNLRICTYSENNGRIYDNYAHKSCKYKGVHKNKKRYYAKLNAKSGCIRLGSFSNPEEAALAYDKAAYKYFGEFAYINFPDKLVKKEDN